ncbi:MAG: FAD/NAD(P)-binding protein [Dehalococcoidales bacterium]|nr:FAD/NAD(P)-binding protein [Dehalococcoidales bacterium]
MVAARRHVVANPLVPHLATVEQVLDLTPDMKLFSLRLQDPAVAESLHYEVGQFALVSVFGVGEAAFDISSLDAPRAALEFAVRRVGTLTEALHEMEEGSVVGVRGPFGNYFPLAEYEGKNLVVIGGGSGMAPLRSVVNYVVQPARRERFGQLLILNGARTPADLAFKHEFEKWASSPQTCLELTVDRGDDDWRGRVALIPDVVRELKPSPLDCVAIVCGPPIMIKFTLKALKDLGFADGQLVGTVETKMKCGIGKCGRCNVGDKYVCLDGPVFTFAEIGRFLEEL